VIRPSFTLGGTGRRCVKKEDFDELLTRGLEASPIHEVLIDKALGGKDELIDVRFILEIRLRLRRQ
jgi:carbamoyl-phosphate synthase large subunit